MNHILSILLTRKRLIQLLLLYLNHKQTLPTKSIQFGYSSLPANHTCKENPHYWLNSELSFWKIMRKLLSLLPQTFLTYNYSIDCQWRKTKNWDLQLVKVVLSSPFLRNLNGALEHLDIIRKMHEKRGQKNFWKCTKRLLGFLIELSGCVLRLTDFL